MAKDSKINSTSSTPKPSVLADTINTMDEYDMNILNDTADKSKSHGG